MWGTQIPVVGIDLYHAVFCFVIYSMGGWLVESIYMSFCNKKLTNRGFGFLPFCPIYGFGATIFYYVLLNFADSKIAVYLVAAIGATCFEFLVGMLMKRLFGEFWWDYYDKPLNYKGVICLESTLAWGVYGLVVVYFLHEKILGLADKFGYRSGMLFCGIVLIMYFFDFLYHLLKALGVDVVKYRDHVLEGCRHFHTRS